VRHCRKFRCEIQDPFDTYTVVELPAGCRLFRHPAEKIFFRGATKFRENRCIFRRMTETPANGPSAARLRGLYHRLVALGERHSVAREDAEELANDTLLAVIGKFDPARGRVETFALTVMMNKVINFVRDHKIPPPSRSTMSSMRAPRRRRIISSGRRTWR